MMARVAGLMTASWSRVWMSASICPVPWLPPGSEAQVVITMLPTADVVNSMIFAGGVAQALAEGACRTAATSASMVNVNPGLLLVVTRRRQQLGLELRGEAPRPCDKCRLRVWAERWRRFSPGGDRLADQGKELFLACWCAHAQQP